MSNVSCPTCDDTTETQRTQRFSVSSVVVRQGSLEIENTLAGPGVAPLQSAFVFEEEGSILCTPLLSRAANNTG
jgi:hypothetical protein